MLTLMMKVLLLLNVNNTVLALYHFCLSKRRSKVISVSKIFHRSRKWVKKEVKKGQEDLTIDQKGGQNGSKRRSKRRSKISRELLKKMLMSLL